ncbi:MAG TPA: hypothetical protein VFA65_24480 [Bryobacteraceae bacterium]|nr:hypothetical protein [Bryobacteraceae bacterium]
MGPEQTRLIDRLCNDPERKLLNFNIFPGDRRCTPEELCAEVNKALDQIERGNYEEVRYDFPEKSGVEPIDVREFVRNLPES